MIGASAERGHMLRRALPEPSETRRADVVIVGSGVAGLAAAYSLRHRDVVVLELEDDIGGNARHGPGYPWGAHYVTAPTSDAHEVRALFDELGVMSEVNQVADPAERLFIDGRWQDGLLPRTGASHRDRGEFERFTELMGEFKHARGNDGRRAFTIPLDRSSRDPHFTALDGMTMAAWLTQSDFQSAKLRWYVDYACRDDFGGTIDQGVAERAFVFCRTR